LRPSSTHSARHRANPAPTRREVRHRERPLRRLRFGRLRRVRCGRARTAGIRGRRAANLIHYGVSDDDAFEVGLSCGGKIDVWLERADPEFWLEVRALLDNDAYGMLYTNTETGEKRLEKGVLESTGLRDDGIFAEGGRRAAARADLRRGRGSGASLRVREAARLAHDARAALVTPERIPSADEIAWGVETRSSCRDAFVFVYEASEKVAAVDL
jgi:xanthine/CO dehydrogenase XdhC/CoxF family maturation factor